MLDQYLLSYWALLFILSTVVLQTMVATVAHRKQTQYIPGVVSESLGPGSLTRASSCRARSIPT